MASIRWTMTAMLVALLVGLGLSGTSEARKSAPPPSVRSTHTQVAPSPTIVAPPPSVVAPRPPSPTVKPAPARVAPRPVLRQAPVPATVASNPARRICFQTCRDRYRQCTPWEEALTEAATNELRRRLNEWNDDPDNAPSPPCVRGYNRCTATCPA